MCRDTNTQTLQLHPWGLRAERCSAVGRGGGDGLLPLTDEQGAGVPGARHDVLLQLAPLPVFLLEVDRRDLFHVQQDAHCRQDVARRRQVGASDKIG